MSIYREFLRNDILFSTVHARPHTAAAWNNGWRGSTGPSASLGLYAGVRARLDVKSSDFSTSGLSIYPLEELETHSIDKVVFVSGSYPATGSIRFVRCTDNPAPNFFTDITDSRWYEEHFRPIRLLYDYYQRLDGCYFTGSYDAYSVLFLNDRSVATLPGSYFIFTSSQIPSDISVVGTSTSWSAEAWVKPLTTGSFHAIIGQPGIWSLGIMSGGLYLSGDSPAPFTSLTGTASGLIKQGRWSHVAAVVTTGSYVRFYVNGQDSGLAAITNKLTGSNSPSIVVGAIVVGLSNQNSANAFVFETRLWSRALSGSEIPTLSSGTLVASGSASGLVHYARFNDGPLGYLNGSGALDYSPLHHHGVASQYSNQQNVHWQPSDHPTFVFSQSVSGTLTDARLFHVPSLFYGKQIAPGSVRITDGLYNNRRVVRVFSDDGRGSLYVSGSMTRDLSGEEYTGQQRRKVGNVFYSEGLVVFTDPALWDMFDSTSAFWNPVMSGTFPDLLAIDFDGQSKVHTKTFNCRLGAAEGNASNNLTYTNLDTGGTRDQSDDQRVPVRDDGTTYITSVGLYNEDMVLVAVARLAQPLRKREKDKQNIRLKIDF